MFRFIDFFNTDEAIFQEKVGTRTYWVFEGNGRFPYTTLISSKVGNKDGGYYGWETKERAIEYIKKQVEEAKQSILRSVERKKTLFLGWLKFFQKKVKKSIDIIKYLMYIINVIKRDYDF